MSDVEVEEGSATDGDASAPAVLETAGPPAVSETEQRVDLRKDRVWLPFLLPVGAILVVALFTINISRVFLAASEESSTPAVVIGVVVTLAVLIGAAVVSAIPKLRTSSLVLTMSAVTAIVMLSGSVVLGAAEPHEDSAGGPPAGEADYDLLIEGSNFAFQKEQFDVPAGIALIKYTSLEGSHTLAFTDPEHAYFNIAVPPDSEEKAELVEGETYTIYCTLPGHRESGMVSTIKVGAPGGAPEAGTETPTSTVEGASTTTAPSGDSEVDPAEQTGNETGN